MYLFLYSAQYLHILQDSTAIIFINRLVDELVFNDFACNICFLCFITNREYPILEIKCKTNQVNE